MLYRLILKIRNKSYDSGRRKSEKAKVPTICVGNVTVGGTGKTPCVEMLLRLLQEEGISAAVLSRGYGRKTKGYLEVTPGSAASQTGDEPLQIKRAFPQVPVAVDKDRLEGCHKLCEDVHPDVIVLDDAFQYRALKADLNIVLVSWVRPVHSDRLLPFGRLRDLPERLNQADIIIVTKCPEGLYASDKTAFKKQMGLQRANIPVLFSHLSYCDPEAVFEGAERRYVYSTDAVLATGIANPAPLEEYVRSRWALRGNIRFGDHHAFSQSDIARIESMATANLSSVVLTTQKDAQRLKDAALSGMLRNRLFTVPVRMEFTDPQDRATLLQALKQL